MVVVVIICRGRSTDETKLVVCELSDSTVGSLTRTTEPRISRAEKSGKTEAPKRSKLLAFLFSESPLPSIRIPFDGLYPAASRAPVWSCELSLDSLASA